MGTERDGGGVDGIPVTFPPFNDRFERRVITPEERFVGPEALKLFKNELIRPLPWNIKAGVIEVEGVDAPIQAAIMRSSTFPGQTFEGEFRPYAIVTEGLDRETISRDLANVIAQFKTIEDYLPDFMGEAEGLFRNNIGISASYKQWGREELQHSLAAGLILERTGHRGEMEIMEAQMEALQKTWQLPFPEPRQVVLYAAFQELHTRDAYNTLARRAAAENAPTVAGILRIIGRDEGYHGYGYRRFAQLYHKFDPEGTIDDAVHVASNFRMPALNLIPDPDKSGFRSAMEVGVYGGDMGQRTMYQALMGLEFVPEDRAKAAVEQYAHRQDRLMSLYARRYQRPSGLVVPPDSL